MDIHEQIAQKRDEINALVEQRKQRDQERQEACLMERAAQDALDRARQELTELRDVALQEMRAPTRCAFLVFAGQDYYPQGGWRDLIGTADTLANAIESLSPVMTDETYQWAHIIDRDTHEVVTTWDDKDGWENGKPDWWGD